MTLGSGSLSLTPTFIIEPKQKNRLFESVLLLTAEIDALRFRKGALSRTLAELPGISPIEGGIVPVTVGGVDFGRFFSFLDQLAAGQQTLEVDVFSNRSAGGLLKTPAELGTADEKFITEDLQIQFLVQIFVDVLDNFLLHSSTIFLRRTAGKDRRDLLQQQDQMGEDHSAIAVGLQHSLQAGIILCFVEVLPVVLIHRAGFPAEEGTDQSTIGIDGGKQRGVKVDDNALIGRLGIQLDAMRFCGAHQHDITLRKGIGSAFNVKSATAGQEEIDLRIGVGMHGEMIWQGTGIHGTGDVKARTGIME